MTYSESKTGLSGLARRLQNDPRFMAYVLVAYGRQEGFDAEELSQELGMLPAMLMRLALCKRPISGAPEFAEQVREIADYTLTDEIRLANVLRQVDSLEKLSRRSSALAPPEAQSQLEAAFSSLLVAARDRDEDSEEQTPLTDDRTKPEN